MFFVVSVHPGLPESGSTTVGNDTEESHRTRRRTVDLEGVTYRREGAGVGQSGSCHVQTETEPENRRHPHLKSRRVPS